MSKHVIVNGAVFLYRDKAPFINSGKSVKGALEYDKDNDTLKCHECGTQTRMLGRHVSTAHGMPSTEYKREHGLNQSTALVCEAVRQKLSAAAQKRVTDKKLPPIWYKPEALAKVQAIAVAKRKRVKRINKAEQMNRDKHCKAQLLEKLQNIAAALKHTPSRRELTENGIPIGSLEYHWGSLTEAMKFANLRPNSAADGKAKRYSNEQLLRGIRLFAANYNRPPRASDYRRGLLAASRSLYRLRFGSLKRANTLAFQKKQA